MSQERKRLLYFLTDLCSVLSGELASAAAMAGNCGWELGYYLGN